jgi:hypothetical protein
MDTMWCTKEQCLDIVEMQRTRGPFTCTVEIVPASEYEAVADIAPEWAYVIKYRDQK